MFAYAGTPSLCLRGSERGAARPRPAAGRSGRARTLAAAGPSDPGEGSAMLPTFYDPATATSWHFVLANADFMLNDENSEHLPELLRERRRFFLENNAPVNFFVVTQPAWLDGMPELSKRVRTPAVAIVSPDATWIKCVTARARVGGAQRAAPRRADPACRAAGKSPKAPPVAQRRRYLGRCSRSCRARGERAPQLTARPRQVRKAADGPRPDRRAERRSA
jgi:hypothetical protein